ncbi:MAG: DUF167 domain-containing protein [Patescibacteria group bacterium]
MIIKIRVITNARKESITSLSGNEFKIKVTAVPEKGKANKIIRKMMAKYFHVPPSKISIVAGLTNHKKVVRIED